MIQLGTDEKRIFVIASANPQRLDLFSDLVEQSISQSMIFRAHDGFDAIFKMENSPPHVLVVDMGLPKLDTIELTEKVLHHPKLKGTSVIIVSPIPDREHFVDEVVTGQVQFLTELGDPRYFAVCLSRALNRLTDEQELSYKLKFLAPHEVLFREGEEAHSVFIVRKGDLHAYKTDGAAERVLGTISIGEFVGEMAHINGEPRSATVRALTDCELIEIPMGTLDAILFSKPAWSKALVATLSKRLSRTNNAFVEKVDK
ncbi:MAG: cyclic AMP receptor protein [Bdellovibrio sp. CG10_big_fil_rev_8_21_14_0_10_47_8]|nr:MAG: cyclic AMP receptor protein [Bdellovibrio sp. CG10_big_fil_rev_8_21_14_0_10_47_8]